MPSSGTVSRQRRISSAFISCALLNGRLQKRMMFSWPKWVSDVNQTWLGLKVGICEDMLLSFSAKFGSLLGVCKSLQTLQRFGVGSNRSYLCTKQCGVTQWLAWEFHKLQVAGSNPAPATNIKNDNAMAGNNTNEVTKQENSNLLPILMQEVESKILVVRNQDVLLDRDVAAIYGVETREVNQAVRNNPRKFREGYVIELTNEESSVLRSNILTLEAANGKGRFSKYNFKAFTSKGLFMLATCLKSERATDATVAIVETFDKVQN